jgi:hypothetical protein
MSFPNRMSDRKISHTLPLGHTLKLANDILKSKRLPNSLRSARLKRGMNNMNMEMIIRRLIYHTVNPIIHP